ncbi:MAG: cob(I)yrinic acid a,c-diamide adenosyltransferase [Burkholderiaceae bacterium]
MGYRLSSIATRTGDDGTTGLGDGSRLPKDDPRVAAMGDVDELNSTIGLLRAQISADAASATHSSNVDADMTSIETGAASPTTARDANAGCADIDADLSTIQHDLFDMGAELCIPGHTAMKAEQVAHLDDRLAHYNADLPALREFILPGGTRSASLAHMARTACRRAERSVITLGRHSDVQAPVRLYLNRLSDLMFVLSRVLNRRSGSGDVYWQSPNARATDTPRQD